MYSPLRVEEKGGTKKIFKKNKRSITMGDYLMSIIKMKYYAKLGIITGADPLDWMMEDYPNTKGAEGDKQ